MTLPDGRTDLIQLRLDTAADWAAVDPVLAAGEPGWDTTNEVLKIGDGVTAWSTLPAASSSRFAAQLAHADLKASSAAIVALEGAGGTDVAGFSIDVVCDGGPITLGLDGICTVVGTAALQLAVVRIMEGANEIQRDLLMTAGNGTSFVKVTKGCRITPAAGLHTYKVNAFVVTATSVTLTGSDAAAPNAGNRNYFNLDAVSSPIGA